MILIRPTRAEKAEQIQQAAFMFARVTRDAEEIAAALGGQQANRGAHDTP